MVTQQDTQVSPAGRYEVDSVRRTLKLMRALVERGSLTLEQAVPIVGSAKSTTFRLLETLRAADWVERAPRDGYQLGPEAVRWSLVLFGRLDIPAVAAEEVRSLWLRTGETVGLALFTGRTIVLTEILESPDPFRMAEVPGTLAPPHSSALGRAVSAYLPEAELMELLGPEPYKKLAARSPGSFKELKLLLEEVVKSGCAIEIEESALGVACVAGPIFQLGKVRGGISVAGPRVRMTDKRLAELGPVVAEAARRISARLSPGAPHQPPLSALP